MKFKFSVKENLWILAFCDRMNQRDFKCKIKKNKTVFYIQSLISYYFIEHAYKVSFLQEKLEFTMYMLME